MSEIKIDIPDITVVVSAGEEYYANINIPSVVPIDEDNYLRAADYATSAIFAQTASYALNAQGTGFPFTGSAKISGSLQVFGGTISGSFVGNGSGLTGVSASVLTGGLKDYIPLWATNSTLTSSIIYQTGSSVLLGSTIHHTPEAPDKLGIYAGVTDSYNAISAHGTINSYFQINIKNFSGGATASSDIVATANIGDETRGYIDMGINNSGYSGSNFIGGPLDAYLYATGSDLLIGNISPGQSIVFFTGGPNVDNTGRMFIGPDGAIGFNTRETTTGYPETLFIRALNDNTYNLITAKSNVDAYSQINIQNESTGSYASSDIVATANNGGELGNYVNIGINSSQYTGDFPGDYGGPNDAYFYTTASSGRMYIGDASPNGEVDVFAGGSDFPSNTKLRIRANNQHELTGSLNITNAVTSSFSGPLIGTASNALVALNVLQTSFTGSFTGSFFGNGNGLVFTQLNTSQSSASELVVGNVHNNYQYKQTTVFKNGDIVVSGSTTIANGGILIITPQTAPIPAVFGGLFVSTSGELFVGM